MRQLILSPILLLTFAQTAEAYRHHAKKSGGLCAKNIATSTMYFVPNVKDYCPSPVPCKSFKKEVKLQGSGILGGNRSLTYDGQVSSMGSCQTAFGASGNCLTPFISVAADPRYYSMGDIIDMPSMKGKKITLPNGETFIHPGYFIVEDTGGAIKGPNRFDFFTGTYGLGATKNVFGSNGKGDPTIASKNSCTNTKAFTVIRRNSSKYQKSLVAIEDSLDDKNSVEIASNFGGAQ